MKPVNIFIAYARKDKDLLEKLRKPLNVLKRHGHCEIFYDGEIKPGEHWDKRLKNELYRAEIIVLLVTDDFLDSDYVNEVELPKAIELHQQGKAYVLPIILRDCMWRFTRISDLQAILKGDCPIDESDGYAWAALQVAEAIDLIRKRRLPSISTEPMITLSGKPYATESSPYQGVDPFQDSMIIVEGASFDMGNSQPYRPKSQKPPHKAKVATFYISKYLVAREQYLTIMGQTASIKEKNEPMRKVSWEDAWTFIKKLNDLTSKNYGLPTEAEWEYAARGGKNKKAFEYSGGNDLSEVGWFKKNSGGEHKPVGTTPKPNTLGIYDMSGNVWEWCEDIWHNNYEGAPSNSKPWTEGGNIKYRVIRGGSFDSSDSDCRVFSRQGALAKTKKIEIGFRLAHDYPM